MLSGEVTGDIESLIKTSTYLSKRTAREQSEDSIQKQLGAFERLLQHAMSRFSKENLYHVLRNVTKWKEDNQKPQHKHATKVAFKLRSVVQLKEITKEMKSDKTKKTHEDDRLYKNYELFLNDLLYLRDLKKYFDDEIHKALLKYHYDASIAKPETPKNGVKNKLKVGPRYKKVDDDDSGNGSNAETDDKSTAETRNNKKSDPVTDKDAAEKYSQTVNELKTILTKWERLLSEDIPDLNDFDPDSYHELMQFGNYSQFETLLRLIPDIFAKCYKCIELAKTWLQQSNIVLHDLPCETSPTSPVPELVKESQTEEQNQQTAKEILKNIRDLQNQIEDVEKHMDEDETALTKYNIEMDTIAKREERFTTVTSEFNKIDSMITTAADDYQKSKTEQSAVATKLRNYPKDSAAYAETKSHLKRLDTEVLHNHSKMKVLEFEKATIKEDYLVELEVRPEFIRFEGDTKEKIKDLERFLGVKREQKLKLEKQLALAKTNTDRMKKIMNAYLGKDDRAVSDISKSPTESTTAWTVKYNDVTATDGNEADIDSPVPNETTAASVKTGGPTIGESTILQKPKLVKKIRDVRPSSEASLNEKDTKPKVSNMLSVNKMPKAALKTSPRRVWENF